MAKSSTSTRSRVMASVKKKDTKLESAFLRLLDVIGVTQYERYSEDLPGHPDIVIRESRVVIFVDSCFWHACPQHLRMPASNIDYWEKKMQRNRERDQRQTSELRGMGWHVLRVWEHEIKEQQILQKRVRDFLKRCQRGDIH